MENSKMIVYNWREDCSNFTDRAESWIKMVHNSHHLLCLAFSQSHPFVYIHSLHRISEHWNIQLNLNSYHQEIHIQSCFYDDLARQNKQTDLKMVNLICSVILSKYWFILRSPKARFWYFPHDVFCVQI